MTPRTQARTLAILVAVALPIVTAQGRARAEKPYSHFEALLDDHIRKGDEDFRAGLYGMAIPHYLDAYDLVPLPPLLVKLARCYLHLGQVEQAEHYFRMYLAMEHEDPGDVEARVEAFIASAPVDDFDDSVLTEVAPIEERRLGLDLLMTAFVSDGAWGPGHSLAFGPGLSILPLDSVMIRASAGYGHEFLGSREGKKGGNTLIADLLLAVAMPRLLGGRILLAAGAITGFRRTWLAARDHFSIFSTGPAVQGRFRFRQGIAFVVEVDACPIFLFGRTTRTTGFEVVIKGGFSFGM